MAAAAADMKGFIALALALVPEAVRRELTRAAASRLHAMTRRSAASARRR